MRVVHVSDDLVRHAGMWTPEFGRLIGWTRRGSLEESLACTAMLTEGLPQRIHAIREAGVARETGQQWADFRRAEAARVANNPNALPRSRLMHVIADAL